MEGKERRRKTWMETRTRVLRNRLAGALTGATNRLAGCSRLSRKTLMDHLVKWWWSLLAFLTGLLLASLLGVGGLVLQKQQLWFCIYSTVGTAALASFGMGLSAGIRASVAVMLPSLCSTHGRKLILFLFVSVLLTGSLTNIFTNMERGVSGVLCGAELAANQTQEQMQRAAMPFFSALDKVKEISSNAYAVARRVQKLIDAMLDSVHHVARTLRNVLHFLVDVDDICNAKLGAPYRKCRAVFIEAYDDCSDLLGDFDFLCEIVNAFLPLCELARVGELFCVIPSYISRQLRKHLAAPTVAVFQRMKQEFEFNITASSDLDVDANISHSPQRMVQDILKEISADLWVVGKLNDLLAYVGLVLLTIAFIRAMQYRRQYLHDISFDNIYITTQFKDLDQRAASVGGASVLPLTRREATAYITPLSLQLTAKERRAVMVGVVSVLKHLVVGGIVVALDFLVFWILDQVRHQVSEDIVVRAPMTLMVQVDGAGYAADIYRDLVSAFNVLQHGNITVVTRKCLPDPSEPNYATCFTLGFLLGLALLVSVVGGLVQRCRRLICAWYHPEREQERIRFLHQKIIDERRAVGQSLRASVFRRRPDQGGTSRLHSLLMGCPGGAHLAHLFGLSSSSLTCLSCGDLLRPKDEDTITCNVPRCSGLYCWTCFLSLGSSCVVCMRPLSFQEDDEVELDSSDDEELQLWSAALNSPHITDPNTRTLMERRISMATRKTPRTRSSIGGTDEDDGEHISIQLDSEFSEADMTYQDGPGSEESDDDMSFHSLEEVLVHVPNSTQNFQEASQNLPDPH
ncbi:DC-STAMP domain-containing protein 2 [Pholidichthys leucotaenia]